MKTRKMKRLATIAAIAMIASCMAAPMTSMTALAVDPPSITINNSASGYKYEAYKIFNGVLDPTGASLGTITWAGNDAAALAAAKEITLADGSTPFASATSAQDVADILASDANKANDSEAAQAFAAAMENVFTTAAASDDEVEEGKYVLNLASTGVGYYLVKNTKVPAGGSYTRYILEVAGAETAAPKGTVPTVEKKVQEDDKYDEDDGYGEGYNDVADWDIGSNVPFLLRGTMPTDIDAYKEYRYVFHDTLATQLDFNDDVVVTITSYVKVGEDADGDVMDWKSWVVDDGQYEVVTTGTCGCTFEVAFADIKNVTGKAAGVEDAASEKIAISSTTQVDVNYTAELGQDAVIGLPGQQNAVFLEFSNNPNWDGVGNGSGTGDNTDDGPNDDTNPDDTTSNTEVDRVIVFTYEVDVTKTDNKTPATPLKDAEFVLANADSTVASRKYATFDVVDKETGEIDPETEEPITEEVYVFTGWAAEGTKVKSDADGLFKMVGIDDGTYYLKETAAPAGYKLPTEEFPLTLEATTANGQDWNDFDPDDALTKLELNGIEQDETNHGVASATITNTLGSSLPSTGGIGTTIFYVVGGTMAAGAGVYLISKKRMKKDEE